MPNIHYGILSALRIGDGADLPEYLATVHLLQVDEVWPYPLDRRLHEGEEICWKTCGQYYHEQSRYEEGLIPKRERRVSFFRACDSS